MSLREQRGNSIVLVSLRAKRGNPIVLVSLREQRGNPIVLVSLRAKRGNPIGKKAFLFTKLLRFARNDILMSCLIIELLYIFFLYFTIGILIPFSLANWTASSYPASAWRATPKPGSTERTRRKRFSVESWPSATMTMPA